MPYICTECGWIDKRRWRRCQACPAINSMVSTLAPVEEESWSSSRLVDLRGGSRLLATGLPVWDELLGGWAGGMLVFMAGAPGSGKTTLCLKLLDTYRGLTLYASTEETPGELAAAREKLNLKSDNVRAIFTSAVGEILAEAARLEPALLVLNSVSRAAGGAQRACRELYEWTQHHRYTMSVATAHLSWQGHASGPRYLEHTCDAVVYCTVRSEQVQTSTGLSRAVKTRWIELRKGRPPLNGTMTQIPIPEFT